ncbi:hypothetical protein NQ317_007232 [Molorchus minor]|uniref:Uncharacterized protein n=1 Tax=Molorchus minor TaxID=1323400 RepID=A0ABQ9JVC2_9CUCU|nr:hypothetical protein NQ317_007232 [Molorchus minor]
MELQQIRIEIENTGKQNAEINRRIRKDLNIYHATNQSFKNNKEITKKTKLNVYIRQFTTGYETWVIAEKQRSMLQATEMKHLRRVTGARKIHNMRNVLNTRQDLEIPSLMSCGKNT